MLFLSSNKHCEIKAMSNDNYSTLLVLTSYLVSIYMLTEMMTLRYDADQRRKGIMSTIARATAEVLSTNPKFNRVHSKATCFPDLA